VPDILNVEVEGVRRMMRRLEYGEGLAAKMTTGPLAGVEREEEAQIRRVRLEDGESSQIVSAVSRDDAQPGIEKTIWNDRLSIVRLSCE
jgi:hypothetical protein